MDCVICNLRHNLKHIGLKCTAPSENTHREKLCHLRHVTSGEKMLLSLSDSKQFLKIDNKHHFKQSIQFPCNKSSWYIVISFSGFVEIVFESLSLVKQVQMCQMYEIKAFASTYSQ